MIRAFLRSLLAWRPMLTLALVIGLLAAIWLMWRAVLDLPPVLSDWSRLLTVIAALTIWLLVEAILFRRRQRADARVLEALMREGLTIPAAQTGRIDAEAGDAEAGIAEISGVLADTVAYLRREMAGRGRYRGLRDEMPWYLLLGRHDSGAADLIQNSGLRMPLEDRIGRSGLETRVSGGSVRWWVTEGALLIQPSGMIARDDQGPDQGASAWRGLLDFLRSERPRRPLDGVVIAVEVNSLAGDEAASLIAVLRRRLQQATRMLLARLQVYVVVTRCDQLAGFTEFVDSLDHEARQRPFGAAMPLLSDHGLSGRTAMLGAEFAKTLDRVCRLVPFHTATERDTARRALLTEFPEQLAQIGKAAVAFATDLTAGNLDGRGLTLRGVFFTAAGTPPSEATALDVWQPGFGRSMGLLGPARPAGGPARQPGTSVFVTGLFKDFVFPEAGLVGSSPRAERRTALRYAACVAGLLITSGLWYADYRGNHIELRALRRVLAVEQALLPNARPEAGLPAVLPLLNQARLLKDTGAVYETFSEVHFGISTLRDHAALAAADENYEQMLATRLLPALRMRLEDDLRAAMLGSLPAEELAARLRVYLMLSDPEHYRRTDVMGGTGKLIAAAFPFDQLRQGQMFGHLSALLDLMPLTVTRDDGLVDAARARLQRRSDPEWIYARLIDQAQRTTGALPVDVASALGPAGSQLLMLRTQAGLPVIVPALYTREGFYRVFLPTTPQLLQDKRSEDWILGPVPPGRLQELKAVLRQVSDLYVRDYVKHWQSVATQVELRALPDLPTLVSASQILSGPDSPLVQLVELVKTHTDLPAAAAPTAGVPTLPPAGGETGGTDAAAVAATPPLEFNPWPGEAIRAPFVPLQSLAGAGNGPAAIMTVQNTLAMVYSTLAAVSTAPVPMAAAHQLTAKVISGQTADPLIGLRVQAAILPRPISGIFRDLYSSAWSALLALSLEHAQVVWSQDVAPACEQGIARRYPFVTSDAPFREQEAALRDFSSFFGPGGVLDKFVSTNLAMFTKTDQDGNLAISQQNGLSLNISREALREINRGRRIRNLLFGSDGGLSLRFSITPSYLDPRALSATLALDQARLTYRHEPPRAAGFSWPSNMESTAFVSVEAVDGSRPEIRATGSWAIFRLLDLAEKLPGRARDQIQIRFKLGELRVDYGFRAYNALNPVMDRDIWEFRCVPRL